jgi:hypothetical protein
MPDWHLLSIHPGLPSNPMVLEMPDWHKSSNHLRLEPNPMVFEKFAWHKSYIHLRLRPNSMGSRQEMLKNATSKSGYQPNPM